MPLRSAAMHAPTARKLCTLSSNFRSLLQNVKKNLSSRKISPQYEETHHHFHSDLNLSTLKHHHVPPPEEDLSGSDFQLSGILTSSSVEKLDCEGVDDEEKEKRDAGIPQIQGILHSDLSTKRNESSCERKHKWIFKDTGGERSDRLLKICAKKLGTTATVDVFGHLGRETGVKEYNGLIKLCIQNARASNDENVYIKELGRTYHLLELMRVRRFQLEEKTYRLILEYVIDMGLVEGFQVFYDFIKASNPSSISRLGYYEMLLWIKVNNEERIWDICEYITVEESKDTAALRESYLLALCESGRMTQILDVLKNIDIAKLISTKSISNIFQSLAKLLLESDVENLLLYWRARDYDADNISNFIASYAVSIPNLTVEDMISKIENLHGVLEVLPSSSTYEKIVLYWCGMHKKMNLEPTTAMYNAILAGHFREKGISGGLRVLKHMQDANVMPDSQTFSYFVGICETEDDINKYFEEMKQSGIHPYYMSLIRDAAWCELEKAKQVSGQEV